MQTLAPLPAYQPELDMAMPSEMPNFFGSPNDWGIPSHTFAKRPNANYLELSLPDLHNPPREHALRHGINDAKNIHTPMDTPMPTYDGFHHQAVEVPQHFNAPPNMYACQPGFTALNTPNPALQNHKPDTISPLQTSFEASFNSSPSFSPDTAAHSATSSTFGSTPGPINEPSPNKRRRHSTWTGSGSGMGDGASSPISSAKPMGRRRQSEQVEPGSARAIYLEKNRKAASKCRGKQRMQQQELVETAREMERKNKQLKAEVEFLKSDMRDLMMIVGRHSDCPDGRLKTYVQREADRLISRETVKAPASSSSMVATGPDMFPHTHYVDQHSPDF